MEFIYRNDEELPIHMKRGNLDCIMAFDFQDTTILHLCTNSRGKIVEETLRKERFTINELQERLRIKNVFNIGDVEYAILETSGEVTIIQKPDKRNTIPQDFNIMPEYEGIAYDLVVDGKVMYDNLKNIGKDYAWLKKEAKKFGIKPEEALVMTIDGGNQIFCQKKEGK